ncbi:hypothetical protein FIBSPDRAFT_1041544 [Athelia psychrophila]|uniref:C3H1-type domain-containing protein n=1 Tax=Athelia psychrophila TaxID=1759441 RepID=A0A166NUU2_9AGAM|nr:hypothetical protein FIBSPDRAFT_1041544 [Fibularhizoctonia sp. CBS 109695]
MVSALWKACSDGDLVTVQEILKDASVVDIEIKDHTGVTPLIEAVKNGHLEVVRALLEKGADPHNSSSQGRPLQYTQDPALLELLSFAENKAGMVPQQHPAGYIHDPNVDPAAQYYGMPPPGAPYGYYPPPPMQDGSQGYYAPPSAGAEQQWPGGPGNLPPADIARFIPCRFFPACRYGASCMFLHPQAPYYPGPMSPPAQYPGSYDPMAQQGYPPNFYSMPPPSFQPPNGMHQHMNAMSPPPGPHHTPPPQPMAHAHSGSELISPVQGHFSPNGAPPPAPYGAMAPVSPSYPHPAPPAPLSIPPMQAAQQAPQSAQSPQAMYNPNQHPHAGPASAPYPMRADAVAFPSQGINGQTNGHSYSESNGAKPPQNEAYGHGQGYRDSMGHSRRGSSVRPARGSFSTRKPACLFFPSGRCKNGDDCRFPHVITEGAVGNHPVPFVSRGGAPRPRGGPPNGNGAFKAMEDKFAALAVQEEGHAQQNGAAVEAPSRSHSSEDQRPRYPQGAKPNGVTNGFKKPYAQRQRVPNADEFPVLASSTTSPSRSPGSLTGAALNGHNGPTAAQVLQAPPPRRDSTRDSTRSGSPASEPAESRPIAETNGHTDEATLDTPPVKKLPISFAAVANGAPDVPKEVSVSA